MSTGSACNEVLLYVSATVSMARGPVSQAPYQDDHTSTDQAANHISGECLREGTFRKVDSAKVDSTIGSLGAKLSNA